MALDMIGDRLAPGRSVTTELAPGQGGVVRSGAERTGVFRDDADGLHAASVRCTHLGCLLRFTRRAQLGLSLPRFAPDVDGAVLEGPAVQPLTMRDPPG